MRTYNVLRELSRRYHVILLHGSYSRYREGCTHIPTLPSVHSITAGYRHWFSQVLNPELIGKGCEVIRRDKPKVIINESIWGGAAVLFLQGFTGIPYILDQQNAEFLRVGRSSPWAGCLTKQWELVLCDRAEKVLCVSEVDRRALIGAGLKAEKLVIIPNGVDLEQFRPDVQAGARIRAHWGWDGPVILFFGDLAYPPNVEAIDTIYREIAPRVLASLPEARFIIVGPSPPWRGPNRWLTFVGAKERIEDYINASDVVICPLRSGGGTRLKILESIACGKPVISTSVGAEGLIEKETEPHLVVRDDWELFSAEVIRLAREKTFPGPSQRFLAKYSWARIVELIVDQIEALPSRA